MKRYFNTKNKNVKKNPEYQKAVGCNPMGGWSHSIKSIQASLNIGVKPDFYFKTFHHDKYWSATPHEYRKEYPNYPMTPITLQGNNPSW